MEVRSQRIVLAWIPLRQGVGAVEADALADEVDWAA